MEQNKIWNTITRKIANEDIEGQEDSLKSWLEEDERNTGMYNRLKEIWDYKPNPLYDSSKVYKKYRSRIDNYQKVQKRKVVYYISRIAAVLIFAISIIYSLTGYLNSIKEIEITYNEIAVPKGSRTSVILPDSSKVWISNNSALKYPGQFVSGSRELFLSGEAYFEVKHDPESPFIVNIGNERIKVLGTKFAVTAYPGDNQISTDLLEGSILFDIKKGNEYKSVEVRSGFGLVYNKTVGNIVEHKIVDGFYNYWKNGIYDFKNESFESLSRKIERIYNVEIVFVDEYLKSKTYSGSFSVNDNIFTFMEAIKKTSVNSIEYTYRDDKIYVKLK